ncbi:MAG: bacterial regulatory helix-turn-helix, lysR family protein [Betaproteobacteria bacterium]|nr:bacterial regulatory helix-turn-helix, lysR family protein [Betaproteobacteria bacterium]
MDKLHAMEVFTKVAELGSFTKAAERMEMAPASVSAAVQNLEAHLGVRLFTRTTRKINLTDDGRAYLERSLRVLAEIEETESALKQTQTNPQGKLRVEIPTGLGHMYVTPALPAFSARYPDMQVVMTLNDRFVDLTEEEVDVILRIGELSDSTMVARRLYEARFICCASPDYLKRHGAPKSPDELAQHNCIGYFSASLGRSARWNFKKDGQPYTHAPTGTLHVNNSEAVIDLAAAGVGIICMLETSLFRAIREGRLVPVLQDFDTQSMPVSALYWPSRHLSAKVRVFIDFIAELFAREVAELQQARAAFGRGG